MTNTADENKPSNSGLPFDSLSLKLESLKYLLLEDWILNNIVEVPSARLPLKTAYLFYAHYCNMERLPRVPIQAFNRTLTEVMTLQWPAARRRRSARGTMYDNITLKDWVPEPEGPPSLREPSSVLALCSA